MFSQDLVLWVTSSMSAGSPGPTCQVETPAGQRAAGRPPEGQPDRSQQHRQQLQPERKDHMRVGTVTRRPFSSRNTETNYKLLRPGVC